MKLSTLLATLVLGLAAGPAFASPHTSLKPMAGQGSDECPHKASTSRNEDRARVREIASRLAQPQDSRSRPQQRSRTIRN